MQNQYPYPESDGVRSIVIGILLTLITCGIYGLYWHYKQMATLNAWLGRDEYSFWLCFFLSLLICRAFGIYYEYKMASGINEVRAAEGKWVDSSLAVLSVLLTIFGLGTVSRAIQQGHINNLYHGT